MVLLIPAVFDVRFDCSVAKGLHLCPSRAEKLCPTRQLDQRTAVAVDCPSGAYAFQAQRTKRISRQSSVATTNQVCEAFCSVCFVNAVVAADDEGEHIGNSHDDELPHQSAVRSRTPGDNATLHRDLCVS